MATESGEPVRYEVADGVAEIVLCRPERRNAIDLALAGALRDVLARFATDAEARAAVLRGDGAGFCSGGDVSLFPELVGDGAAGFIRELGPSIHEAIACSAKPVVAAVHGFCVAGGFELALACQFVYASRDAVFGMEEVKLGLLPGWGGTVRLATAVPPRLATELLLTGRRLPAEEARDCGAVNRVLDSPQECLSAARETARRMAGMPAHAVARILAVVRAAAAPAPAAMEVEREAAVALMRDDRTQERIAAVLSRGVGRAARRSGDTEIDEREAAWRATR
jgi:enoyl-CoA hydratase/carnithine racemase